MNEDRMRLPAAAALAYEALASDDGRQRMPVADGLLDVVAIALATAVPIDAGDPPRRLTDDELARGHFRHGASVLQFSDGTPPLENLSVLRTELDQALARLKRAGVSFSEAWYEQAPRRLPRVMPV